VVHRRQKITTIVFPHISTDNKFYYSINLDSWRKGVLSVPVITSQSFVLKSEIGGLDFVRAKKNTACQGSVQVEKPFKRVS